MKRSIAALLLGLLALLGFGCGASGGSSADPNVVERVSLVSDAVNNATSEGSVVLLTAHVKSGTGEAIKDDTVVTFSSDNGILSATKAKTVKGKATITITSSVYTTATITANVAGKSSSATVFFDDRPFPATVSLDKTPSQSYLGRDVTITVTIKNAAGDAVADGTAVTFGSTGGTLSATSATSIGGRASVTLVSPVAGTFTVSCSVTTAKGTISVTDDIAFGLPPFNLIAHRGYGAEAPENTVAAFNKALALGATALECDLQVSADGGVVIIHDFTVDRTTNGTGAVTGLTAPALRTLDAGTKFNSSYAGEKIPLLSELIEVARSNPGIRIMPEIKGYRTTADIALMVRPIIDAGLESRTTFQSFHWSDFTQVRKISPTVRLAYLCGSLADFDSAITLAHADGNADIFIDYHVVLSNPEIVRRATAAGVELTVWTVDTWATVQNLQASGVFSVMSNWGPTNLLLK
jgi:glycerophosphoryl diester phosphodiesterase